MQRHDLGTIAKTLAQIRESRQIPTVSRAQSDERLVKVQRVESKEELEVTRFSREHLSQVNKDAIKIKQRDIKMSPNFKRRAHSNMMIVEPTRNTFEKVQVSKAEQSEVSTSHN